MMTLVIGGSGSGKSSYAEDLTEKYFNVVKNGCDGKNGDIKKYYIATMQVYGDEGQKKVDRHREKRKGKGFITIEQPTDIGSVTESRLFSDRMQKSLNIALLECVSNLTANEMFRGDLHVPADEVVKKVTDGIASLKENTSHLIVVSNNVFEDGNIYDKTTMAYIEAMGKINRILADMAENVVEVVVGIPISVQSGEGDLCI